MEGSFCYLLLILGLGLFSAPQVTTSAGVNDDGTTSSLTYIGFVVDNTGSMRNEIEAVKEWITNCVNGKYPDCKVSGTGGWLMTSFNDPRTGPVVGPTTDVTLIIDAIDGLGASGGGDCPEYAFTGLLNAVAAIPDDPGACRIFFYTDALPKDEDLLSDLIDAYVEKGCVFVPLLTGCCGPCEDPCLSTDPEYCINHVIDDTSSSLRRKRRTTSGIKLATYCEELRSLESLYYALASKTGGTIFLADKPSSPEDLLEFLEKEVTLGFCPTTDIAGPPPNGYLSEKDCNITGSCWDRSTSKCYCMSDTEPCPKHPIDQTPPDCPMDAVHLYLPDGSDCTKFYQCASGRIWRMPCAPGTVFDASKGVCNHPYATPPPCGTFVNEEKKD